MPHRPTRLASLFASIALVVVACDGESPSAYPVRVDEVVIHWCPNNSSLVWDVFVGLSPHEPDRDVDPPEWPGGFDYTVRGPTWAAGGGERRFSGCSHASWGCGLSQEQQEATRWVIADTLTLDDVPTTFELRLAIQKGHQPDRFLPGTRALDLRLDLGRPDLTSKSLCPRVPVVGLTEVRVAPGAE